MIINVCRGKIHKARLTACELDYEGSLLVDIEILNEAGIFPYEKILVSNANNGERLETYAIPGEAGKREVMLNGPAAMKGNVGDVVTIMAFGGIDEKNISGFKPKIVVLNEKNEIMARKGSLA